MSEVIKSKVITLAVPIDHGGGNQTAELTMRRPKVRDIKAAREMSGTAMDKDIALYAALTGQPPSLFDDLDALDWEATEEAYDELMPSKAVQADLPPDDIMVRAARLARDLHQPLPVVAAMDLHELAAWERALETLNATDAAASKMDAE